jgi:hypothetical protein
MLYQAVVFGRPVAESPAIVLPPAIQDGGKVIHVFPLPCWIAFQMIHTIRGATAITPINSAI